MDGNKRKITLSVSPTLLLLAVLVLAGLFLFTRTGRKVEPILKELSQELLKKTLEPMIFV